MILVFLDSVFPFLLPVTHSFYEKYFFFILTVTKTPSFFRAFRSRILCCFSGHELYVILWHKWKLRLLFISIVLWQVRVVFCNIMNNSNTISKKQFRLENIKRVCSRKASDIHWTWIEDEIKSFIFFGFNPCLNFG